MIRKAGIECPLDLAILGVDNDELLCNMSSSPMSSIDTNWQGMGYAVAEQLDALISGRSTRVVHKSWRPKGVVERNSTDFLGIDDDIVVKALLYIQRHIKTQITVSNVMSAVGVCRPTLDDHFKKTLNRTTAQEINRLRLEKARQLLTNTTMTIEAIALDCGFLNPDRLYRIFQRQLNTTPGKYRTMHTKRYLN
jgi:LacI family transcriptional regulator